DGADMVVDVVGPLLFRARIPGRHETEGVDGEVGFHMAHGADDGRRVYAARKACSQRHIAAKVQPDILQEMFAYRLGCLVEAVLAVLFMRRVPPALLLGWMGALSGKL